MYEQILQFLRQFFYLFKRGLYIAFIYFLLKDLSGLQQGVITTALVLAVLWAILIFLDPVVDLLLRVGIIALVVVVSLGYCGEPNLVYGICGCGLDALKLTYQAITDVIHRLLACPAPAGELTYQAIRDAIHRMLEGPTHP